MRAEHRDESDLGFQIYIYIYIYLVIYIYIYEAHTSNSVWVSV